MPFKGYSNATNSIWSHSSNKIDAYSKNFSYRDHKENFTKMALEVDKMLHVYTWPYVLKIYYKVNKPHSSFVTKFYIISFIRTL